MKRFTVFFSVLSLLAFWAAYEAWFVEKPSPKVTDNNVPIAVYDATGEMLKAIHPERAEVSIAPVYDATGAMWEALDSNKKVVTFPAYDATVAMQAALNPDKKVITLPAYDATGAMQDAIQP